MTAGVYPKLKLVQDVTVRYISKKLAKRCQIGWTTLLNHISLNITVTAKD